MELKLLPARLAPCFWPWPNKSAQWVRHVVSLAWAFVAAALALATPAVAQELPDEEVIHEQAEWLRELLGEAGTPISEEQALAAAEAAAEAVVDAFTIPETAPAPGLEWAHFYQSRVSEEVPFAFGTTQWRLEEGTEGLVLIATVAIPAANVAVEARFRQGSMVTIDFDMDVPESFGNVRSAELALASSYLIDNEPIAETGFERTGPNSLVVDIPFLTPIEDRLAESAAMSFSLRFENRQEVIISLALGETGQELLREALASWKVGPPWLDLTTAVPAPGSDETAEAYLFIEEEDGTIIQHDATLEWDSIPVDPPLIFAIVTTQNGATIFSVIAGFSIEGWIPAYFSVELFDESPGRRDNLTATFRRFRFKDEITGDGTALIGDRFRSGPGLTLFALSPAHHAENRQVIYGANWFEADVTLADGRRAAMLFSIGEEGHALFRAALPD